MTTMNKTALYSIWNIKEASGAEIQQEGFFEPLIAMDLLYLPQKANSADMVRVI